MRTVTAQEFARSLEDVESIARRAFAVEDLPEWIVEAVAQADMDDGFRDLDRLMD